jgi:galactokinase
MKLTIDDVRQRFQKHLGGEPGSVYASPGRINLIGEHTDYNGGFVFPGAVEQGMIAEIRPNGTRTIKAYSIDLKDYDEFSLDDPKGPKASHFRYIYGVAKEMEKLGVKVMGFDTAFAGDVPLGAGMSSSAALESCYAFAINDLFGDNKVSKMDLAKAGQATEHNYLGLNCGIMDQFASVHGKKGNLMRLDCRSGEFEYFPWNPKGYRLVLVNSCVKHELVGSPYNDRRKSCENVVKAIKAKHPEKKIDTLREATWDELKEVAGDVSAEDLKRATFVLGEKDRVLAVCDALEKGDYETVGQKMYETHYGLSKEYDVSCEELDFLNDVAKECSVTGSRIMGGGFGGCTINLVADELYDNFTKTVVKKFKEKYGKEPIIIDVVIGDGSRKLA